MAISFVCAVYFIERSSQLWLIHVYEVLNKTILNAAAFCVPNSHEHERAIQACENLRELIVTKIIVSNTKMNRTVRLQISSSIVS